MLNQLLLTSYRSIVMKKREREGRSSALSLLTTSEILQQKKKFEKIDLPKKGFVGQNLFVSCLVPSCSL